MGSGRAPGTAQTGAQHPHSHEDDPTRHNLHPGPVGTEGRSLQSSAGVAGSRGRAQGLRAKEVLPRQVWAQLARGQGGKPGRQALNKVTLGQGWAHRSPWPPAQCGAGRPNGKNEEVRVTRSSPRRYPTHRGAQLLGTSLCRPATFPRAGRW